MSCLHTQDKDVTEASSHILDLTGRLRDLETSLMQSRSQESKLLRDLEENKQRYRESRHEAVHLKGRRVELELHRYRTQCVSRRRLLTHHLKFVYFSLITVELLICFCVNIK